MNWHGQAPPAQHGSASRRPIVVGLVNNTSDRARKATETQFVTLLRAAAGDAIDLQLKFFACRAMAGTDAATETSDQVYLSVDDLFEIGPDAVIVTGMEPQAATLPDEPIWHNLTKLADWAEKNAIPVVWSCLAAHAAVFHLDGIARTALPGKLSGVFDCDIAASGHKLLAGLPKNWRHPHSRYYTVPENQLAAHGYQVLSRSGEAGVDIFVREKASRFVFFQGHPEYDAESLLREYKRDVRRYITGERNAYPAIPRHYFSAATEATLSGLRDHALQTRDPACLGEIANVLSGAVYHNVWRDPAVILYSNWLADLAPDALGAGSVRKAEQDHGWAEPEVAAMSLVQ